VLLNYSCLKLRDCGDCDDDDDAAAAAAADDDDMQNLICSRQNNFVILFRYDAILYLQ
jgi:hypothetical protein